MIKQGAKLEAAFLPEGLFFKLTGEIDHHNAKNLRMRMDDEIILNRPKKTVIDLSGVDFMDSSGLGLIMGRYNTAREVGGILVLRKPCQRIAKVLSLAGIERIVTIES